MKNKLTILLVLILSALVWGHEQVEPLRIEIKVDGNTLPVYTHQGKLYIEASRGREYSIILSNRSERRLAVALAVDGLNTIDAKHTPADKASKWVLEPWERVEIAGWQVSQDRARKFYFTTEADSYGAMLGKKENLGIISAVVFREKARPVTYSHIQPAASAGAASPQCAEKSRRDGESATREMKDDDYAATGMGQSTDNRVIRVDLELEKNPCQTINYRYEYRSALVRLGVLPAGDDILNRREGAHGFSGGAYCPEIPR